MKKIRITAIILVITLVTGVTAYAAAPDIFTAGENFVDDVKSFLLTISSAVAVIGIAMGGIICKFAAGNPQTIAKGSAAIKWCIASWVLINGASLILSTLATYF